MENKKYEHQKSPFIVPTTDQKYIGEHVGKASNGDSNISIAHMKAPPHWTEPSQKPEFDEYTIVVKGKLHVHVDGKDLSIKAGESIHIFKGNAVRYSNPYDEWCEYVSVCKPAFDIETVYRTEE